MLRRFSTFQVATTCFSCSPPDLNLVVTDFVFCVHVKQPLPPGDNPIAVNTYITIFKLQDVQVDSGVHPASSSVSTGILFWG